MSSARSNKIKTHVDADTSHEARALIVVKQNKMFKVVQTFENGKSYICAVPSGWEKNGILEWPTGGPGVNIEKLRSNPTSIPNSSWSKTKCVVKKNNCETFKDALSAEVHFLACSDTEAEEM